jgi:hypothetical protein
VIFMASIDTTIYDVPYAQGQPVDTEGWTRTQLLQFLSNGLIFPAGGGITAAGSIKLDDLFDVVSTSPGAGYVLAFDPPVWSPVAPYELGLRLTDMSDVDLLSVPPTNGQTLAYDEGLGKWLPASGATMLDGLGDVDTTTDPPTDGQALVWDDGAALWVPGAVAGGGGSPADLGMRYIQVTADTTWVIDHTLNFYPNVTVVDSAHSEIWPGDVSYPSPTQVVLTFSAAVGGEAYLS